MSDQLDDEYAAKAAVEAGVERSTPPANAGSDPAPVDTTSDAENATDEPDIKPNVHDLEIEADDEPQPVTYYLYRMLDDEVGVYEGKTVTTTEAQPENSSVWAPRAPMPGEAAYHYQGFWVNAPMLGTVEALSVFRSALVRQLEDESGDSAYPSVEADTFARQLESAQKYLTTGTTCEFLLELAKLRGIDISEMAKKIVAKNEEATARKAQAVINYQKSLRQLERGDTSKLPLRWLLGFA